MFLCESKSEENRIVSRTNRQVIQHVNISLKVARHSRLTAYVVSNPVHSVFMSTFSRFTGIGDKFLILLNVYIRNSESWRKEKYHKFVSDKKLELISVGCTTPPSDITSLFFHERSLLFFVPPVLLCLGFWSVTPVLVCTSCVLIPHNKNVNETMRVISSTRLRFLLIDKYNDMKIGLKYLPSKHGCQFPNQISHMLILFVSNFS